MNTKLLKVLEDLYEIRAHLRHKRFSVVQRRRIDRVTIAIREMFISDCPTAKPCASFWRYVRGGINVGLIVKAFTWIERVIKSTIQGE